MIEPHEDAFHAFVPALPGCHTFRMTVAVIASGSVHSALVRQTTSEAISAAVHAETASSQNPLLAGTWTIAPQCEEPPAEHLILPLKLPFENAHAGLDEFRDLL